MMKVLNETLYPPLHLLLMENNLIVVLTYTVKCFVAHLQRSRHIVHALRTPMNEGEEKGGLIDDGAMI